MRVVILAFLSSLLGSHAVAEIRSIQELCDRGADPQTCREAELYREIEESGLFGSNGKFAWTLDQDVLSQLDASTYQARAMQDAQVMCTEVNRVVVNEAVSEYERLAQRIAVNRVEYEDCMAREMPIIESSERERRARQFIKVFALAALPVMAFCVFWYRRPIARRVVSLSKRIRSLGAE